MAYREESTKVVHLTGKLSSCHCKFETSSIQHPLHSFTVPGSQFLSYITWGMMYMEKYCTENLWSLDLNSALQCPDVTNNPGLNFKDDRVKQTQQCSAVMGENIATDDYVSHLCRNRLRVSATIHKVTGEKGKDPGLHGEICCPPQPRETLPLVCEWKALKTRAQCYSAHPFIHRPHSGIRWRTAFQTWQINKEENLWVGQQSSFHMKPELRIQVSTTKKIYKICKMGHVIN